MFKTRVSTFCLAALCVGMPAIAVADEAQIAQLQAELRVTREQLAAANQQVATTVASATLQIQALQRELATAKAPPADKAAPAPKAKP